MILAIDFGSTSFKAAVMDRRLNVLGLGAARLNYNFASGGRVELDVAGASSALRTCIVGALRAATAKAEALKAVAVTSQAQTFTIVDKRGRAKMRFISWQDNRAGAGALALRKNPALKSFGNHCSFGEPLAALQLCQMKHLQDARPGFLQPDDLLLNLPTYFVSRLTGTPVIDDNLAAMSGLYSLERHDWWPAALKACGIRSSQLPRLVPIGNVATPTTAAARDFALPAGLPVILAGNDQTAGAYGARLEHNNALLLTLGTAQVSYVCQRGMPRPKAALVRGPYPNGWNYRLAADGCGGNIINWAQSILANCADDKTFFAQAALASPGCAGLVFEPTLDNATGIWKNIGLHHTPPDFARSVVEALARRMVAMTRRLVSAPQRHQILVAGGGSQSRLFVKILSETLRKPIQVTTASPHIGAARMGFEALRNLP